MAAPPDHTRAPEVERALLKDATEQFARLLDRAIRGGRESDVEPSDADGTERPLRFVPGPVFDASPHGVGGVAMKDYLRAWRAKRREVRRAIERQAQREQHDLLAPAPRPRPRIGEFTIMDLADDTCRFPFGDGPFLFCGAAPVPGKPYCTTCIRGLYRIPPDDDDAPR